MELSGKIVSVLPELRGTGRSGEWVKNYFVIEYYDGNYPVKLCLEVYGADKWEKMRQSVAVGAQVQVKFGISSHEYNGRWFTSCQCFYCSPASGLRPAVPEPAPAAGTQPAQPTVAQPQQSGGDSLPF